MDQIITNEEYARAYKEIFIIINLLEDELKKLIPEEKIQFYKTHMDENHNFNFEPNKSINEQNILYPTRCILANLFKEFIATEEDKEIIFEKERQELIEIEEQKKKQYNPDDIFKNRSTKRNVEIVENDSNTELIEYKEPFFTRFKNFILKLFHINK